MTGPKTFDQLVAKSYKQKLFEPCIWFVIYFVYIVFIYPLLHTGNFLYAAEVIFGVTKWKGERGPGLDPERESI